ncbi:MAG: alpha/beta fold hydrolase, partial [Pseudomonadota bacterium]
MSLPGGIDLWTRLFDATDLGTSSPALLMLHGTAETGDAYRQWIPHLAREFRIVCPDLRGMGRSTRISPGSSLEMNALVDDVCELMRTLGIERYSVVGEKAGALLALRLAARHPDDVQAMALACGMIAPRDVLGGWVPGWIRMVEESGVRAWVDATQAGRMGDELSPRALEWWNAMMAASDPP